MIDLNENIFLFAPEISCLLTHFHVPCSYHSVFSLVLSLPPCHRAPVNFTRWEIAQLLSEVGCHISLLFILTLLPSFILFLLCPDKKVICSYLCSPILILLLFFCYSFPNTHSDYFTPLLEALQSHPNALGKICKLLLISHKALQALASAFLSDSILHHSYPAYSTWATWAFALCLDKPSYLCFWPFVISVQSSLNALRGWLVLSSSYWKLPLPS